MKIGVCNNTLLSKENQKNIQIKINKRKKELNEKNYIIKGENLKQDAVVILTRKMKYLNRPD